MSELKISMHSKADLDQIHQTALKILEEVGVKVEYKPIYLKLKKAGAVVDELSGIVKLPSNMVYGAIKTAPSEFELHGTNGEVLQVGNENKYFGPVFTDPIVVEYGKGPREEVLDDIVRNIRIADSLPGISFFMVTVASLKDVPKVLTALRTFSTLMSNTTKHFAVCLSKKDILLFLEMAEILAQGKSLSQHRIFSIGVPITSPLTLLKEDGEILDLVTKNGIPMIAESMPSAGATAPFCLSGSIALCLAETLFLLTTAQILRPGIPVILENGGGIMNMKIGEWVQYSLERALFNYSIGEIGRYYNLPTWGVGGGTQVTRFDIQNGMESMLMVFAGMMSTANMVCGIGSCAGGLGVSAEQIVIDHDFFDVCRRLKQGVKVDEDHLCFDSIKRAGPGGNFLVDPVTIKMLHSEEHFNKGYFDYKNSQNPEDTMYAKAHERVGEILGNYCSRVPKEIVEDINRFAKKKEKELLR